MASLTPAWRTMSCNEPHLAAVDAQLVDLDRFHPDTRTTCGWANVVVDRRVTH
jgi:hypothetical protein